MKLTERPGLLVPGRVPVRNRVFFMSVPHFLMSERKTLEIQSRAKSFIALSPFFASSAPILPGIRRIDSHVPCTLAKKDAAWPSPEAFSKTIH